MSRISQDPSMKMGQRGGGGMCLFNLGDGERERRSVRKREKGRM